MDCKINWTIRAWLTYKTNIDYLEKEWTAKEVSKFVLLGDKRLTNLSKHPGIGNPRNKNIPIYVLH